MPDSVLWAVSPEDAIRLWDRFGPLLEPAIERSHGTHSIGSVQQALANGHMQLWASYKENETEAVATTEIITYADCKVLSITLLGGRARERWLHFQREFMDFAAQHLGWEPVFETWRKPIHGR